MNKLSILIAAMYSIAIQANDTYKSVIGDTLIMAQNNVNYKAHEDDTFIYLKVSTSDKNMSRTLIKKGLTVYFDATGNEEKNVYVKYPNEPIQKSQSISQEERTRRSTGEVDYDHLIKNMNNEGEYGYFNAVEQIHKDLNTHDISVYFTSNNDFLEFYISIPKTKISAKEKVVLANLSIGVMTNKWENNGSKTSGNTLNKSRGSRQRSGRAGGRGGRQGGRNKNTTNQNSHTAIDFWFNKEKSQ